MRFRDVNEFIYVRFYSWRVSWDLKFFRMNLNLYFFFCDNLIILGVRRKRIMVFFFYLELRRGEILFLELNLERGK